MSREKIIEIAASQVGTKESPANSNKTKYGKWYGFDGFAWCAMFVSWVYDQAGHPLGHIDDDKGYRDCRSGYNHWKATGEITNNPEKGDIVLFDWTNDGRADHTGIFNEWLDAGKTKFSAYEGNTAVGNDSDGGQVMFRKDRKAASVKAFVKVKVLSGLQPATVPDDSIFKKGDNNANVANFQKQLYDLGYKITVDGIFGSETEKIVKQFQKENKLTVTGKVTPALLGLIDSKLRPVKIKTDKLTTGIFLKKGNSGNSVVTLQAALNKSGAKPKIDEDGVYGDQTVKAVKSFQTKNKLKVDGEAGPETFKALGIK
ncbi:MAG: peptidoglycan-binding protein [Bacteroidia bacterium]|nr:peptidoglycan-binding protein [Bacteroidia bacterium]